MMNLLLFTPLSLATSYFSYNAGTGVFYYTSQNGLTSICQAHQPPTFSYDGKNVSINVDWCKSDTVFTNGFEVTP